MVNFEISFVERLGIILWGPVVILQKNRFTAGVDARTRKNRVLVCERNYKECRSKKTRIHYDVKIKYINRNFFVA